MLDTFSETPIKEVEVNPVIQYKAVKRMPGGGTSNVYEVELEGQSFAVKASPFSLAREESTLSSLSHPNILPVLESGRAKLDTSQIPDDKNNDIVVHTLRFKFIPTSLTTLAAGLSEEQIRQLLEQQRAALDYMHSKDIVHTDIKSDNVLVEGETSYLSDFGNSKRLSLPAEQEQFEQLKQKDIADFQQMSERLLGQP
ncbi:protein kinase family protein [Candidatus Shapirobacteria bacterium]|nr:protein kinase family protein [Candidatus Shapirobacteria bacterium]